MARYPGATWLPVAWANARSDSTPATIVVLHLTASEATSQYGWFNDGRSACSHFHVDRAGVVEQYIDTDKLSAAEYQGSNDAISIETQGADPDGPNGWGSVQLEAIAQLLAWIHTTHGIPLVLIGSSRVGERGVGWHRLGIDGNFPALPSILAGRLQRPPLGESWSTSTGKTCPGDTRIRQIPALVERARSIVNPTPGGSDEDMTLFHNNESGAVIFVCGDTGLGVLGSDYAAFQAAGVPIVHLTATQFDAAQVQYGA